MRVLASHKETADVQQFDLADTVSPGPTLEAPEEVNATVPQQVPMIEDNLPPAPVSVEVDGVNVSLHRKGVRVTIRR